MTPTGSTIRQHWTYERTAMVTNRRAPDFSRFARATVALWFALGALAVFFVADAIVFRQPGVAVLDRWASGLVPVAILIVAGAVLPRLRTGIRGWLSTMIGVL